MSSGVDHGDLRAALSAVHARALVLPLGLYLLGQVLSAVKWWMLGSSVGLRRPLGDYIRFYFIGMFLNVFGLSTIGGDVVRGLYLGDGRRPGLALNSVIFDRISGLAILMAMGAIALWRFRVRAALAPQCGVHRRRTRARGGVVDLPGSSFACCRSAIVRRQVGTTWRPSGRSRAARAREPAVAGVPSRRSACSGSGSPAGTSLPFSYCW
jgi:hypothetical protein